MKISIPHENPNSHEKILQTQTATDLRADHDCDA